MAGGRLQAEEMLRESRGPPLRLLLIGFASLVHVRATVPDR